ncbi:MAG TPA: hypothetical protein VFW65_31275 [Pseudonocardiaceae bacterium]|nr:hypothetical protein [Pseudonocardiaceae bacterium]
MWLRRTLVLAAVAGLVSGLALAAPSAADTQLRDNMVLSHTLVNRTTGQNVAVYDYAPTVVQEGDIQHYYWCGYGDHLSATYTLPDGGTTVSGGGVRTDNIYYRSYDTSTHQWQQPAPQEVFWPSADAKYGTSAQNYWDSAFTCNPTVITGDFTFQGTTYHQALYYVGARCAVVAPGSAHPVNCGIHGSIGVAFTNDWVHFTRYTDASGVPQPVLQWPCAFGYGYGQPSAYNLNGSGGIRLFYVRSHSDRPTEPGKPATCAGGADYQIADSTDGVHFGSPNKLTTAGITENRQPENAAFAYDKDTHDWYMSGEFGAYKVGSTTVDLAGFSLYRLHGSDLTSGTAAWQKLTTVDTVRTGFAQNFIPTITRDRFGNVNITGLYPDIQITYSMYDPRLPWSDTTGVPTDRSQRAAHWDINQLSWEPGHPLVDLRRYYSSHLDRHVATTGHIDTTEFALEDTSKQLGALYEAPNPSDGATVAMYLCKVRPTYDYFVSTQPDCEGQTMVGLEGYGYAPSAAAAGRVPWYRCIARGRHFVSNDPGCEGLSKDTGIANYLIGYAHAAG